ncbi:MAG: hypothetical protein ABJP34_08750 [Erythrobacter sp.]
MKNLVLKTAAAAMAMCALAQPQMAMAQSCIEEKDFADATVYALPLIADAFSQKCGSELSADGFMATKGDAFLAPYRAQQDANWPATLKVLKAFGADGGGPEGVGDLIASLPEESLRPFIDAIIGTMVAKDMKLKDCGKIERGIELMSPLPPENVGGLLSFVISLVEADRTKEGKKRMLCAAPKE